MTSKSLKQAIFRGIASIKFSENNDEKNLIHKLIVSAVTYDTLSLLIKESPELVRDITTLANKYGETFKPIIEGMVETYVVYKVLYNTVKEFKITSFVEMSESQIKKVNELFRNKTKAVSFETVSFSQYMYKVAYITMEQLERLRKIHYNIMVPIADYYKAKNNIKESDFVIYNSERVKNNPGKEISFLIKGVSPATIIKDIKDDRQLISKYIYKCYIEDEKVVIITN